MFYSKRRETNSTALKKKLEMKPFSSHFSRHFSLRSGKLFDTEKGREQKKEDFRISIWIIVLPVASWSVDFRLHAAGSTSIFPFDWKFGQKRFCFLVLFEYFFFGRFPANKPTKKGEKGHTKMGRLFNHPIYMNIFTFNSKNFEWFCHADGCVCVCVFSLKAIYPILISIFMS